MTNIYTIQDTVSETYGPLFEATNHAVARRAVQQMKITTPQDFKLHYIASRENENITPVSPVEIPWEDKQ